MEASDIIKRNINYTLYRYSVAEYKVMFR